MAQASSRRSPADPARDVEKRSVKGNGGSRKGSGRKPHVPNARTRKMVQEQAGHGLPQAQIATLCGPEGVSETTLVKYYRRELDVGVAKANARVGKSFFARAMKDAPSAKWWTISRMGWKDTSRIELTGAEGAPLVHTVRYIDVVKKV